MRNHGILTIAFAIGMASAFTASALEVPSDLSASTVPRDLKAVRSGTVISVPLIGTDFDARTEERRGAEARCRQSGGTYAEIEGRNGIEAVCVYE